MHLPMAFYRACPHLFEMCTARCGPVTFAACLQMLRRWLSGGDDVIALTALLVYLALAEAPLHHTASPPASIIPRPTAPRTPRQSSPDTAQPPPLLTPALVEEITACCARLLSRRAAPFTRSVAFTAVAAIGSDAACMPCIDTDSTGVDVSMRDALVAGLAHAGFCGTSAPSCQALLAPLTPVFYHGSLPPPTTPTAAVSYLPQSCMTIQAAASVARPRTLLGGADCT